MNLSSKQDYENLEPSKDRITELMPAMNESDSILNSFKNSEVYTFVKRFLNRPKEKEIVAFMRELSILVEARVPLVRALNTIKNQSYGTGIVDIATNLEKKVEGGGSLSEGLEDFPQYFSGLYINVIRAGEASGRLERVLNYLADYREKRFELKRKISGALIYPLVILVSFAGVFAFLMFFVMPTLSKTLTESGVKLPWTTKFVIGLSDFFGTNWPILIIIIVGIVSGVVYYSRTDEGTRQWDLIKLKIPIIGQLLQFMYMNRFADNLGLLLRESVPITRSLEITAGIMGNYVYQNVLIECINEVQRGKSISGVLSKSKYFPSIVYQILRVGEEAGKTSETLTKIAEYYAKEVDNMTQNMTTLIEPVLILLLGAGTAVIVASVIMPIYNMAGSL